MVACAEPGNLQAVMGRARHINMAKTLRTTEQGKGHSVAGTGNVLPGGRQERADGEESVSCKGLHGFPVCGLFVYPVACRHLASMAQGAQRSCGEADRQEFAPTPSIFPDLQIACHFWKNTGGYSRQISRF